MSLITHGFYSGKRYVTEDIKYNLFIFNRDIINFKTIKQDRKISFLDKEEVFFKTKNKKHLEFYKKEQEVVKWKI